MSSFLLFLGFIITCQLFIGCILGDTDCNPSEFELYKDCGDRCLESCEPDPSCTNTCVSGCFCRDGYKREYDTCVEEEFCEPPPNITPYPGYTTTPPPSSDTTTPPPPTRSTPSTTSPSTNECSCKDQKWRKRNECQAVCPKKKKCSKIDTWDCYCKKGLKWDACSKKCVHPKYCPHPKHSCE